MDIIVDLKDLTGPTFELELVPLAPKGRQVAITGDQNAQDA